MTIRQIRPGAWAAIMVVLVAAGCENATSPNGGVLEITTKTSGVALDPTGYVVKVDGFLEDRVQTNGSVSITGVSSGERAVGLTELAPNCEVRGANPQVVDVSDGASASASFEVACGFATFDLAYTETPYTNGTPGASDLYLMDADGTNRAAVTTNAAADFSPAWSPNGSKLAFTSDRGGSADIYILGEDGGDPVPLTASSENNWQPAWAPDGTRIAFVSDRGGYPHIYVMNADGTDPVPLTTGSAFDSRPAWSPDGSRIAFTRSASPIPYGDAQIYLVDPDGTNLAPLTEGSVNFDPAWSPDGSKLAFVSDRDGDLDPYVMNPDGTGAVRLASMPYTTETRPTWSPDGTRIAFDSRGWGSRVWVVDADGSGRVDLTVGPAFRDSGDPAWRP